MNNKKQSRFLLWILFFSSSLLVLVAFVFVPFLPAQLPDFLKPGKILLDKPSESRPKSKFKVLKEANSDARRGPRITYAKAADLVAPGEIWEIFLVLEDKGGDLKSVEWELRQFGPGGMSKGALRLSLPRRKPKEGQEKFKRDVIENLRGYIEFDTAGPDVIRYPNRFDGLRMQLTLVAINRSGLQSERRVFPLTFRLGAPHAARPVISSGKFSYRLGSIVAVFPDPLRKR